MATEARNSKLYLSGIEIAMLYKGCCEKLILQIVP